jgi:hypothetical protein
MSALLLQKGDSTRATGNQGQTMTLTEALKFAEKPSAQRVALELLATSNPSATTAPAQLLAHRPASKKGPRHQ